MLEVTYSQAIFKSNKKLAPGLRILADKNRDVFIVKCEVSRLTFDGTPDWALCCIVVKALSKNASA